MRFGLLVPLLAAACAAPGAPPMASACPAPTERATIAEAYFGRSVRDRHEVTEAEWTSFLAEVVTPAFPDGLTALDGHGQWRNAEGRILREGSKVLVLVLPGQSEAEARARLHPIAESWKARFRQQSVLTVFSTACISF